MHPALSILVFTVTSGFGYGLMTLLIVSQLLGGSPFTNANAYLIAFFVAFVLMSVGLLSSTFHLANPKNAWRAFNRFRTSWLSREGVLALLYYPIALSYVAALWLNEWQTTVAAYTLGAVCIVLGFVLTHCTAMIYASLKTIPQWHTRRVPFGFSLFFVYSGVLAYALAVVSAGGSPLSAVWIAACVLAVIGLVFKLRYFSFVGEPSKTTINTATTFTEATVRLFDTGHSAENFLQKEFAYIVGPKTQALARKVALTLAFIVPLILSALQFSKENSSLSLAIVAVSCCYLGLLLERWLFFIEAKHVVRRFYGEQH